MTTHTSPASSTLSAAVPAVKPFGWFNVPAPTGDAKPAAVQLLSLPIEEVKDANARAGQHWFEPASMRFFRSRVAREAFRASSSRLAFFVSSEQFVPSRGAPAPRRYSVRVCNLDSGNVDTLGGGGNGDGFQAYKTAAQAATVAKRAAVLSAFVAAGWGTCPTTNGRDLETWEDLGKLSARVRGVAE